MQTNIGRFRGIDDIKMLDEFIAQQTLGLNDITQLDEKEAETIQ